MFDLILDSVEDFHTVEERRLHRIFGGLFIRGYYAVSPGLVRHLGSKPLFQKAVKMTLDSFVSHLKKAGFRDTPYHGC